MSRKLLILDGAVLVAGSICVAGIVFNWLPPRLAILGATLALVFLSISLIGMLLTQIVRLVKPRGVTRPDARGNEVSIFPPDGKPSSLSLESEQWVELRRLRLENPPPFKFLRGCLFLVGLYVAGMVTIIMCGLPILADSLLITALSVLIMMLSQPGRRRQLHHTSDLVVRLGCCPTCCYSLKLLPHAEDGCTVCPECGSAWRLPEPKHASGERNDTGPNG